MANGLPGIVGRHPTREHGPLSRILTCVLPVLLCVLAWGRASADSWSSALRTTQVRNDHTLTLLPTGEVLAAGGDDFYTAWQSSELFDPTTGLWRAGAPLVVGRTAATAVVLASGKVLVVGGLGGDVYNPPTIPTIASAELYDPVTGEWTLTGSLHAARAYGALTLLPDGRVVVLGGISVYATPLVDEKSAEIYDPATGTWSATTSWPTRRMLPTTTLLPNGKILVTGGYDTGQVEQASTLLYDPGTGTFTAAASMGSARGTHTATLLPDGRVLVTGGTTSTNTASQSSAELFDYTAGATGSWTAAAPMASVRSQHLATLLPNGKLLVAGGQSKGPTNATTVTLSSAEIFDPGTGAWTAAASLPSPLTRPVSTMLANGKVLVAGGISGATVNVSLVYDPAGAGAWSSAGSSPSGHERETATILPDGRVLVTGDVSTDLYDPVAGTWTTTGGLATPRLFHTAALLASGKVLVVGGLARADEDIVLSSAELYDPATGTWTATGSLSEARYGHAGVLLADGRVLVATGVRADNFEATSSEIYDPAAGTWSTTGPMIVGGYEPVSALLADGRALVAGGLTAFPHGRTQVFDPRLGTWSEVQAMGSPRVSASARLLPSGKVLVVGGSILRPLDSAELFDPAAGTWAYTGSLSVPRDRPETVLLTNGDVLAIGGRGATASSWLDAVESYDPISGTWTTRSSLASARFQHNAVPLLDGRVLVAGGVAGGQVLAAEIFDPGTLSIPRRPTVTTASATLAYGGAPLSVTGGGFRGDSEATSGQYHDFSARFPLIQVRSMGNDHLTWVPADPRTSFPDGTMTLTASALPSTIDSGWSAVRVVVNGLPSAAVTTRVLCSLEVEPDEPADVGVPLGARATFTVTTQGGRHFQWERDLFGTGDFEPIDGATGATYETPPVTPGDSGALYRVQVDGACPPTQTSREATLTVTDAQDPAAALVSPRGGEYWLLSPADGPANRQIVSWSMSDDIRICQVDVSLVYSDDGGLNYVAAPSGGGLPAALGNGGSCTFPGVIETNVEYIVPAAPPSGASGSLYKIELTVTDQAGNATTVRSPNPFYIVQPNPDTVRTLILHDVARMQAVQGISSGEAASLLGKLQEVSGNPRVQGLVIDLGGITDVQALLAAWDADPSSADKANAVLFGCHGGVPTGCGTERDGVHDTLRSLLQAYSGVRYLVIVGDDAVIPFARLQDGTTLLPESTYPSATPGSDLTPTGSTVGRALAGGSFLSDDPLTMAEEIHTNQLAGSLFVPDLAVGRLVERPAEITTAIAAFISQDGVLDLSALDAEDGHKVLVTGYDFLTDSSRQIGRRWKSVLCDLIPAGPGRDACLASAAMAPVDAVLLEGTWGLGSVGQRVDALRDALSGHGGPRYAIASLSGHATHFEEGVPGTDPFDINGLGTIDVYGDEPLACAPPSTSLGGLGLAGGVVVAVGCHGGLPVTGSCYADADHSLDLPQTMLSRGVVAYVANTGYGWGLKYGIGYSERLMELFTEELTNGGTVAVGDAVRKAKQRYFLETPRYDSYDGKSLMQWTLFGLPMYAIKTGLSSSAPAFSGPAPTPAERPDIERFGGVTVERRMGAGAVSSASTSAPTPSASLPAYLTQLNLSFDFSASGVYEKHGAAGDVLPSTPGCPDGDGCYYTLNGIVQRSTGSSDLPIQPYFIYDSRLSGTSQHGVLWKGGTYAEETGWVPVIATLQSNASIPTDHGSAPRVVKLSGIAPRLVPGLDPPQCRPSDLEVNSLVVDAGEAVKDQESDLSYTIERRYLQVDLEVFYLNDRTTPGNNCDRDGPSLDPGPFGGAYHDVAGSTITWAVPASDPAGVWRVLVVASDNQVDGGGLGRWAPIELTDDFGTWRGALAVTGTARVTYVIQAVDRRGNVTWLDYQPVQLPASGIDPGVPATVDVPTGGAPPGLVVTGMSPTVGPAGTRVTLTGSGFSLVQSANLQGVPASFSLVTDDELRVTIPIGAATGPITVVTPTETAHSPTFRVTRVAQLSITDVRVSESRRTATLQVSLSTPSSRVVTVTWATRDGTAHAGTDYAARRGTLRFLPGTRVRTVTVPIVSDRADEANETFRVTLSNASNAGLARATGTVTILDDDGP